MATGNFSSQAVHLTSLDLEVSGVTASLNKVKQETEATAAEIRKTMQNAFASETGSGTVTETAFEKSAKSSLAAFESLNLAYKQFVSTVTGTNLSSNQISALKQNAETAAKEVDLLTSAVKNTGKTTQDDLSALQQYNSLLKELKGSFADAKTEANKFGEGITLGQTTAQIQTAVKNITSLINQYSSFQKQLSSSKLTDTALGNIPQQAESARAQLEKLKSEITSTGKVTQEQTKSFNDLRDELSKLKTSFNDANTYANKTGEGFKDLGDKAENSSSAITDFVNKLSDKVKWLAAYELIVLVEDAFSNLIGTIKNTEDAVVQLQRVLNEDIESSAISDELYRIADQYGQTFDNVQETAVLFAQTGQSWQEVIASTEATMLALNTAELEVTDATSGLIAVMAQFGIEATDLESVIDKINITADNFAVTSQSIVEALQRSGGTASAYNMTLEQTVGIITALAEATGRSGSALGTALNSLITFSMKASSLEKFSDYLGINVSEGYDVLEIWTMLSSKINDSGEELAKMMAGSEEFAGLFNEEMATAIGLTDEYNAAMMNSQDVYSAVGTYRQNYFIALLNNIQTAIEAINGMTDAEGYSQAENEKYMETLTANYNQLVIAAKELAVQFGEMGFLDLLKLLTNLGKTTLDVTKNFGGLYTILSAISTLTFTAKIDKVVEKLTAFKNILGTVGGSVKTAATFVGRFVTSLVQTKSAAEAATIASNGLKLSMAGIVGLIGTSITAVVAITSAYKNWKEEMRQARQEQIELGKTSTDEAKNILTAYQDFIESQSKGGDELDTATEELLQSLGYEFDMINGLVDEYGTLEDAIDALIDKKYDLMKADAEQAKIAAEQKLQDVDNKWFLSSSASDSDIKVQELLSSGNYSGVQSQGSITDIRTGNGTLWFFAPKDYNESIEYLDALYDALEDINSVLTPEERNSSEIRDWIVDQIKMYEELNKEYQTASDNLDLYGESWDDFVENVEEKSQESQEAIEGLADSSSVSLESLQEQLDSLSESYDAISSKIDEFQSAYSTLNDVINEYNETGIMSADMLQTLLSLEPEYINLLDISANSITIKGDATNNLVAAQDVYLQQLAALRIEEYATQLQADALTAANQGLTLSEYEAANGASLMSGEVYNLIIDFLNGQMSADDFANSLLGVGNFASIAAENVNYFRNAISGYAETISGLLGSSMRSTSGIQRYYTPKVSTTSSSTKNAALESEKEALQDEIDLWEKKKEEVEEYYDAQIEALQEVQDSNDRINEQLDYYNDRQEVITNLEQAQARSGVEYRQKEMEYQQELIDLEKEWQDQLEDWDIEDQIDQLEMLKEKSVEEISAVIEALQEKVSELSKSTATSVASGVSSGLSYASSAVGLFSENVSDFSEQQAEQAKQKATETAETTLETYQTILLDPLEAEFIELLGSIQEQSIEQAAETAKAMMEAYRSNLISPFQRELQNAMRNALGYYGNLFGNATVPVGANTNQYSSTNNVNMYANIGSTSAANSTAKALSGLLKFPSNPSSFV